MILITGNCGFIGRHFTRDLDESLIGYDIVNGKDIRNECDLDLIFEEYQPDTVIHLAALAGVKRSSLYPNDYITTNVTGTWNIVKMCEKYNSRLIYFSSSSIYGNNIPPIKETADKNPISLYGITKLAAERIVNNSLIPTTIIRPFSVYGDNGRKEHVILKWVMNIKNKRPITILGDTESTRGYTYVGDVLQAIKTLINIKKWKWDHEDFNLGGPEPIKLLSLLDVFKEIFDDIQIEYKPNPPENIVDQYADISKAKKELNYNPEPLFIERVKKIINNEKNK